MKYLYFLIFIHISCAEVLINSTHANDNSVSGPESPELRQSSRSSPSSLSELHNSLIRVREQRNGMLGLYFNPNDPISRLAAIWWGKVFEKPYPTARPSTHGVHGTQTTKVTTTTTPSSIQESPNTSETTSEKPEATPSPVQSTVVPPANLNFTFPYPSYFPGYPNYPMSPGYPMWPTYPQPGFPPHQTPIVMQVIPPVSMMPMPVPPTAQQSQQQQPKPQPQPPPQLPANQSQVMTGSPTMFIPNPGNQGQLQQPSKPSPPEQGTFPATNLPSQTGQPATSNPQQQQQQQQQQPGTFPNQAGQSGPNFSSHQGPPMSQNQILNPNPEPGRPTFPGQPNFSAQTGQQNLLSPQGPGQPGLNQNPPGRPNFQPGQPFPNQNQPGQPNFSGPQNPSFGENRPTFPGVQQQNVQKPGQPNFPPLQSGQPGSNFQNPMMWMNFQNQQGRPNLNLQNQPQPPGPGAFPQLINPHRELSQLLISNKVSLLPTDQVTRPGNGIVNPLQQPELLPTIAFIENLPISIFSGKPSSLIYAQSFAYPNTYQGPEVNDKPSQVDNSPTEPSPTAHSQDHSNQVQTFTLISDSVNVTDATEGNHIQPVSEKSKETKRGIEFFSNADKERIILTTQRRTASLNEVRIIPLHSMLVVWRPRTNVTGNGNPP